MVLKWIFIIIQSIQKTVLPFYDKKITWVVHYKYSAPAPHLIISIYHPTILPAWKVIKLCKYMYTITSIYTILDKALRLTQIERDRNDIIAVLREDRIASDFDDPPILRGLKLRWPRDCSWIARAKAVMVDILILSSRGSWLLWSPPSSLSSFFSARSPLFISILISCHRPFNTEKNRPHSLWDGARTRRCGAPLAVFPRVTPPHNNWGSPGLSVNIRTCGQT